MAIYKKEPGESNPTQFSPGQQNIVPVTQAQYNALTTAEKNNGTVYHIIDKNISFASADQIDYDNSTSGLEATKVQGALDEINSDLSELVDKSETVNVADLYSFITNHITSDNVGSAYIIWSGMVFKAQSNYQYYSVFSTDSSGSYMGFSVLNVTSGAVTKNQDEWSSSGVFSHDSRAITGTVEFHYVG